VRYSTINQLGTFTAFDISSVDYLRLVPGRCTGGADADVRTTEEDAPGQHGVLVFPPLDGAQIITLSGDFSINSGGDPFAANDTILASLRTALNLLRAAPGNLVHSGGTLKVWKHAKIEDSWQGALLSVTFSVVVDVFA
jgi:hypothetical protein